MNEQKIKIHYPNGVHNNYGIEFLGLQNIKYDFDNFSYSAIQYFVNSKCPKILQYFYQGGFAIPESSQGWGFIEFWNARDNQDIFLDFVLSLASIFNMEVSND